MIYALFDYIFNITKDSPNGILVHGSSTQDYIPILALFIPSIITGITAMIVLWYQNRLQRSIAASQQEQQRTLAESQGKLQQTSADYQKQQVQLNSIMQAFKILNSNIHRQAREIVYCAYHLSTKGQTDIFEIEPYRRSAAMVRADMDQIGILVDTDLIDKDTFLKMYWNTVIICWKSLGDNIKRERLDRDYDSYMTYFSKLNDAAIRYRDDNKLGKKDTFVYSKDDCDQKFSKMKINNNG